MIRHSSDVQILYLPDCLRHNFHSRQVAVNITVKDAASAEGVPVCQSSVIKLDRIDSPHCFYGRNIFQIAALEDSNGRQLQAAESIEIFQRIAILKFNAS